MYKKNPLVNIFAFTTALMTGYSELVNAADIIDAQCEDQYAVYDGYIFNEDEICADAYSITITDSSIIPDVMVDLSVQLSDDKGNLGYVELGAGSKVESGGELSIVTGTDPVNTPPYFTGPTSLNGIIGESVSFPAEGIECNDDESGSLSYTPTSTDILAGPPETQAFVLSCSDGEFDINYNVTVNKNCPAGMGWSSGTNACQDL